MDQRKGMGGRRDDGTYLPADGTFALARDFFDFVPVSLCDECLESEFKPG